MCGVAPGEGEPAEASLHLLARSAGSGHGGLLLPAAAGRGHSQIPQHLRLPHPHATGRPQDDPRRLRGGGLHPCHSHADVCTVH